MTSKTPFLTHLSKKLNTKEFEHLQKIIDNYENALEIALKYQNEASKQLHNLQFENKKKGREIKKLREIMKNLCMK